MQMARFVTLLVQISNPNPINQGFVIPSSLTQNSRQKPKMINLN